MVSGDTIIYESKKTGSDVLVIVPCFNETGLLIEHIECLSRQTSHAFDALLVLSASFPEKEIIDYLQKNPPKFGVIAIKEKENTGSAGGFFEGQKYALENGYRHVLHADVDCLPVDPELVENLLKEKSRPVVSPTIVFSSPSGQQTMTPESRRGELISFSHYTLVSADVLKKYGLYYAPFYGGYEDAEYMHRVAKVPRFFIGNKATHPEKKAGFFLNPEKMAMYAANTGLFMPASDLLRFSVAIPTLLSTTALFCGGRGRRALANLIKSLVLFRFGKKNMPAREEGKKEPVQVPAGEDFETLAAGATGVSLARRLFRKSVLLSEKTRLGVPSLLLFLALPKYASFQDIRGRITPVSSKPSALKTPPPPASASSTLPTSTLKMYPRPILPPFPT